MLGLFGVTSMETRVAEVTVSEVAPEILPDVAVIVVEPASTEVDKPLEPHALLMLATQLEDEPHVTAVVKFCVVLSE